MPIPLEPDAEGFEIECERRHQEVIEELLNGKGTQNEVHRCEALLYPEPNNRTNSYAVAVQLERKTVGYLNRMDSKTYRKLLGDRMTTCQAEVIDASNRGPDDQGQFGVRLNIQWPPRVATA